MNFLEIIFTVVLYKHQFNNSSCFCFFFFFHFSVISRFCRVNHVSFLTFPPLGIFLFSVILGIPVNYLISVFSIISIAHFCIVYSLFSNTAVIHQLYIYLSSLLDHGMIAFTCLPYFCFLKYVVSYQSSFYIHQYI